MGRVSGMTGPPWNLTIATADYGPAGELTSLNGDTRTYNTLGQLTRINGGGIDLEYVYTAGQNNGRITQQIDHVSGEQVTYQYDQLNRLSHAETLDNSWGLSYGYDGFGNLTAKTVTKGTPPLTWTGFTVAYDPATNHGAGYDANGNAPVGGQYPYDVENRLTQPVLSPSWSVRNLGDGNYVYDPWGKRIGWRQPGYTGQFVNQETKCEVHFYGITGQKLASYSCGYHDAEGGDGTFYWSLKGYNVYLAGHLVQSNGVSVTTDRLGSVRANGSGERFNYLPHGEERTPTADGREKFATYIRDSGGLDYADQRYYDRGDGRFLTPDPGGISTADPRNPASWNRYAYAGGDPINFNDPRGRYRCLVGAGEYAELVDCDRTLIELDHSLDTTEAPVILDPGPAPLFHVGNPRKEGAEYLKVQDAFARTLAFLDPDCEAFLNSGGGNVQSYVSDLLENDLVAVGDFDTGKAAFTNAGGTDLPAGYAAMVFNSGSAFFNSTIPGTQTTLSVDNGKLSGGTAQAQVFIILHELGHAMGAKDFRDDFNNGDSGKWNDKLIDSNCKRTLGAIK